ncbi:MAG TPA: YraN family protein [Solirubrobacteraceae bacterium]|nr:YraN family protein [Solirubrobacteraceae bacterium]
MCGRAPKRPTVRPAGARRARGGDPRHALGRLGERLAAAHLRRLGYEVLASNVRTRHGEIDLIAFGQDTLVFAEVKTRTAARADGPAPAGLEPLAALRPRQRARLRRLALAWLAEQAATRPRAATIRFDALGVHLDREGRLLRLDHVEGAW